MRTSLFASTCLFLALAPAGIAHAQSGAAPADGAMGEIVAAAQKRSQDVQKVPIAMAAISSDTLIQKGATQVSDIAKYVPGLDVFLGNGSGFPEFHLRGIGSGSFNKNTTSTVAVYLDEVVLDTGISQSGQMFDLERVEVLNGPQGTLYGKNSTGGAINFITRRPDGSTKADGTFTVGRYGEYDLQVGGQIALSDNLSVRVSGSRNYSDGYGYNVTENRKTNGTDNFGARIGVRYKNDRTDFYLKGYVDGVDDALQEFQLLGTNTNGSLRPDNSNPFNGYIPVPGLDVNGGTGNSIHNRNYGIMLNGDIDLGYLTLTTITGYVDSSSRVSLDTDGQPAAQGNVPQSNVFAHQFSQELRLSSPSQNAFSWIAGVNFFTKHLRTFNIYDLTAIGYPLINQTLIEDTTSFAGFVDATLKLGNGLTLTGGVRFTRDEKQGHYLSSSSALFRPYDAIVKRHWTEPTWRAVINYQINNNAMVYVSYSRGYRAGALNNGFVTKAIQLSAVNPEFVDNYEGGLKGTLFDRHLRFAAAVFYMKFRDQQLDAAPPVPAGTPSLCCTTTNAGRSRIYGVELNGSLQLGTNFTLNFAGNVLDAKFEDFQYSPTQNYAGSDLGYAPKYKVVLSPEYRVPFGPGDFFLASDITLAGRSHLTTVPNAFGLDIQRPYQTVDGQLGYRWSNGMSVFAWMKNVTNERVLTRYTAGYGYAEKFYTPPQSYGLTVMLRY